MISQKGDADEIRTFMHDLERQPWLNDYRRVWPRFLYHITDIHNAVSILRSGRLYSRNRAIGEGLMVHDNASPQIIGATDKSKLDFVRLYFRPKTPTFHANEGIRPEGKRELGAHCAIPVGFLFDSASVLCRADSRFTDSNLKSGSCQIGNTSSFLRSLPFQYIYHDTWYQHGEEGDEIHRRRQAEVLVPDVLPLKGHLKFLFVRSEAEFETLKWLLRDVNQDSFLKPPYPIRVSTGNQVFYKKWTFVERVTLSGGDIRIDFNEAHTSLGPFDVSARITDANGIRVIWEGVATEYLFSRNRPIKISNRRLGDDPFRLRLTLDDSLAYEALIDPWWDDMAIVGEVSTD